MRFIDRLLPAQVERPLDMTLYLLWSVRTTRATFLIYQ
jgi:hypothetical protein